MRALRFLRRRFRGKESIPLDIRISLVGALYQDSRSLVIGSLAAIVTSLISAWKTDEPFLHLCALGLAFVFIMRAADFKAFAKRSEISTYAAAIAWELRYVTGAACHVALLGLWCFASFARTSDPSVQLLSFAMTLAYLIGVSGRNFTSRPLVISQIVCAGVPMGMALLIAGTPYYVTLVFVLAPLFLALKLISERLRGVFLDAVISNRTVGAMAAQLDAALNNMAQGVCMFDAAQRIVVCNARYAEMYSLTNEQVKPGTTLRQIIECRIAKGVYAGASPEEYMRERLASVTKATNAVQELSDGRAIAITRRPMPGGGWVTTHHDVTEQRRNEARIEHMAHHDALTDLPNRALLNQLQRALDGVKEGEMVAVHLIDLDHFKNVNDTQGHPAGDKLLNLVANRLRALLRETDTVARMGGDEFAIVQVEVMHPADAAALANRLIEVVSEPYEIDGGQVIIATSVGIAISPSNGHAPDELMRNADLALYRAKGEGRGAFHFFEPEMHAQVQTRRALESDLRNALMAGEFELHYQPTVNLKSNEISGFEALLRWHHPERGMVPPATFIPLAEENGLILALGEWVIQQACVTAAKWPDHARIAVNLSPAQFRSSGLMTVILRALTASGIAPNRLELEITETSLLEDTDATLAILRRLRSLGVRIALDDFGKGYSSPIALNHLIQHKLRSIAHLWGRENMTFLPAEDGMPGAVLRVAYPAGSFSPGQSSIRGGAGFELRALSAGAASACLSYRVRFPIGFDFVKGGKLPGLFGGENPRGCVETEAPGFSARLMWRTGGAGELYLYAPGRDTRCGHSIGRGSWIFEPGRWTSIKQRVVMNALGVANGSLELWIDGKSVVKAEGLMLGTKFPVSVDGLIFSTFFGGGDASWATPRDQVADFADFALGSDGFANAH